MYLDSERNVFDFTSHAKSIRLTRVRRKLELVDIDVLPVIGLETKGDQIASPDATLPRLK